MFAVLIATLAHDVQEQDAALGCVDHVFEGGTEKAEGCAARYLLIVIRHFSAPSFHGSLRVS
jgi:hypothetical protein